MRLLRCLALVVLLARGPASAPAAAPAEPLPMPAELTVAAVVESSLATASGRIRQFAFDGDPDTFFASDKGAGEPGHLTLVFDEPVTVTSIVVTTGRPDGGDRLDDGALEVSG